MQHLPPPPPLHTLLSTAEKSLSAWLISSNSDLAVTNPSNGTAAGRFLDSPMWTPPLLIVIMGLAISPRSWLHQESPASCRGAQLPLSLGGRGRMLLWGPQTRVCVRQRERELQRCPVMVRGSMATPSQEEAWLPPHGPESTGHDGSGDPAQPRSSAVALRSSIFLNQQRSRVLRTRHGHLLLMTFMHREVRALAQGHTASK